MWIRWKNYFAVIDAFPLNAMCGICGKICCDGQPVDEDILRAMCRSIRYRGPDDEGVYLNRHGTESGQPISVGLGHKRLAIVDLSPAAHQPMSNEDGSLRIAYNGEIYNYRKLRGELEGRGHTFKSNSDTEVVLHLYEEEGLGAVEKLNGMFAFALWDQKESRLWVGRDRLGIKPIVYFWDGQDFTFASELKALLADPTIPKKIDFEALFLYLTFNYIPAPFTIFKGIKKLEPGHYLEIKNGKLRKTKYWDVARENDPAGEPQPSDVHDEFYKQNIYDLLAQSVQARMVADVPLGAFLSGGIDSSIIVALMSRYADKPVQTFSIGYRDDKIYDETNYARAVADRYHTEHHEFKLSCEDMLQALPGIISSFDEPFADSSAIPTYIVSRETRKHVTVALSGDGGDELFAGYRSYLAEYWYAKYMALPGLFREGLFEKIVGALPDSRDSKSLEYIRRLKKFVKATKGSFPERILALKEVFPKKVRHAVLVDARNEDVSHDPAQLWVERWLNSYRGDRLNGILYFDMKDSLPGDMLTKVDWMSMKNSLEVRVPFLDHRLVETAFQMPGSLKLKKGRTKYILKETFKNLLPPSIYRRPKAGFEVPISRWLKNELKFLIEQYLSEPRIRSQAIFDPEIVNRLVGQHLGGRTDTSWMLWNLIVFQCWYDNYFH